MIVVTTPTGGIGSQVVAKLVEAGEKIRVIVRDASKLASTIRDAVETVEGSQNDAGIVEKAFEGADAIFWIVPPQTNVENVTEYYKNSIRIAAQAAQKQRVKRAVWVSTLGEDTQTNAGHLSAALAADPEFLNTGIDARILCPATFMENLLRNAESIKEQGTFSLPNAADVVLHTIATQDIAAAAVQLLTDASWSGQERVPLVGPDNLTPSQMAEVMSEVLGRHIAFQQRPIEGMVAAMTKRGMSEAWARGLVDMYVAQSNGFYDKDAMQAERAPTSFKTWCEDVLRPLII